MIVPLVVEIEALITIRPGDLRPCVSAPLTREAAQVASQQQHPGTRDSAGLAILDREECLRLLATVPVGRIVFTEHALPAIRPVNFVVHDGAIIIRTGEGGKLAAAADGAVVAFEADEFDLVALTGWSVTAVGQATVVTDPEVVAEVSALPVDTWAPGDRSHYIFIALATVTGRRIDRVRP